MNRNSTRKRDSITSLRDALIAEGQGSSREIITEATATDGKIKFPWASNPWVLFGGCFAYTADPGGELMLSFLIVALKRQCEGTYLLYNEGCSFLSLI